MYLDTCLISNLFYILKLITAFWFSYSFLINYLLKGDQKNNKFGMPRVDIFTCYLTFIHI